MEFRKLRADEIDCRVGTINASGCTLLLYKDARCDMNILDETVGAENWQRSHEIVNGNLFCNLGIRIERADGQGEWIWKQDVGTESNTEKEKGEASDAFKRAAVNWGIGRELYTAPFIWISKDKAEIDQRNGKPFLKDKLIVKEISYNDAGRISGLVIYNATKRADAFSWSEGSTKQTKQAGKKAAEAKESSSTLSAEMQAQLEQVLRDNGIMFDTIRNLYKVENLSELSPKKAENILAYIPDIRLVQRKSELNFVMKQNGITEEKICSIYGKTDIKSLSRDETEDALTQISRLRKEAK